MIEARPAAPGRQRRGAREPIVEPGLPIVDAHHHLWFQNLARGPAATAPADDDELGPLRLNLLAHPRYLFDELLADATRGHDVRATVFVESHAMYRADPTDPLRSVGEIEFANGVAAMAASGTFGNVALCAAIVGGVDLRRGDPVAAVLEAHVRAGGGRYRGVRPAATGHDPALPRLSRAIGSAAGTLADPAFRAGFARLAPLGLSADVFLFESQLAELGDLAAAFPETQIILDHVGMPVGLGRYAGTERERFPGWRAGVRALADHPNVAVKLGGLGNAMCGFPYAGTPDAMTSDRLAQEWRPYIETCVKAFGVDRCMFESNFPVDAVTARYEVIWNAFKKIAAGASPAEKRALFSGTAARLYRVELPA